MRRFFAIFVAAVASISLQAADYIPKPLPVDGRSRTESDKQMRLAYNRETLVGDYDKQGRKNPNWDTKASEFLEHWAWSWAIQEIPMAQRAAEGRALIDLGCDDPMVLYCYGRGQVDTKPWEALPLMRKAADGLAQHPYSPLRRAACYARICDCLAKIHCMKMSVLSAEERSEWDRSFQFCLEAIAQSLTDERFKDCEWLLLEQLDGSFFPKQISIRRKFDRRLTEAATKPGVEPWLRHMIVGQRSLALALAAWGEGGMKTMTAEEKRIFDDNIKLAREHLVKAYDLRSDVPQAAEQMIAVCMADGLEPERLWFDRAIEADLDRGIAYEKYIQSLLSRWHGSRDRLMAFAWECLSTERWDTDVPFRFLTVCQAMIGFDQSKNVSLWRDPKIYEGLVRMWQGYSDHSPIQDPVSINWRQSAKIAAAYACGDLESAAKWQRSLMGEFEKRAYGLYYLDPAQAERAIAEKMRELAEVSP